MRFDEILGGYVPNHSVFHKADPRIKLLYTLYGLIVLFFIHHWIPFLIMGIVIFMMFCFSKIGIIVMVKSLKAIWVLIVLAFFLQLLDDTGRVIISWSFITVTEEGITRSFIMVARLCYLIWLSLLLTATTSPMRIADSTESIFKTIGIKKSYAHDISMIMSLAIRFIPIISIEAGQIIKAQTARGAKFEDRRIIKRVQAFFPLIIPLLVSSFKRADELALAMDVRYYNGYQGRTRYIELKMKISDYFLLIGVFGLFTFILFLEKAVSY